MSFKNILTSSGITEIGPNGGAARGVGLDRLERGFEFRSKDGCLSSSFYVVLSCVCRRLCNGPITRPEESYQVSK
jgi:hypothetical protein